MYVACPTCQSVYPVSAAQLRAAGGRVRCGNCNSVFEASTTLFDDPQQALAFAGQQLSTVSQEIDDLVGRALDEVPATALSEPAAERTSVEPVPDTHEQGESIQSKPGAEFQTDQTVSVQRLHDTTDLVEIAMDHARAGLRVDVDTYAAPAASEFVPVEPLREPLEAENIPAALLFETGVAGTRTSWGSIAAALFLTLLLLGQYTWAERYRLAGIPDFRPYLDTACAVLGCDLPLRHETAKLEVLEREIRNHPHASDALLVNATFVNRADFAQRYPIFEVTFSDVSGTPVAMRRFLPSEYLDDVDLSRGMAPGQQTRLMLEIVDPGDRAVSFQFDFL
jgi:predicted Zn finger-like uncharacterized protein